jgi:hypothetical protein
VTAFAIFLTGLRSRIFMARREKESKEIRLSLFCYRPSPASVFFLVSGDGHHLCRAMEAAERENALTAKKYSKDRKVGEGKKSTLRSPCCLPSSTHTVSFQVPMLLSTKVRSGNALFWPASQLDCNVSLACADLFLHPKKKRSRNSDREKDRHQEDKGDIWLQAHSQPERTTDWQSDTLQVGQFRDGLDMSAIREVKFLQELKHPNVVEVRVDS